MEFKELQSMWQTTPHAYDFNEQAVRHRISAKKNQLSCIANTSEWLVAGSSLVVGVVSCFITNAVLVAIWMFACVAYVIAGRVQRLQASRRYDRSLKGDLQSALHTARYQVRLAQLMRWNVIPLATLLTITFWGAFWLILLCGLFLALTFYASKWELHIYKRKKQEFQEMLNHLQEP